MHTPRRQSRALPALIVVGSVALTTILTLGPFALSLGLPGEGPAGDLWRALADPYPTTPDAEFTDPTAERDAQRPGRQPDGTVVLDDGSEYKVMDERPGPDGDVVPITWSSCHPIRYVVDPEGAPKTFERDVALVMAELHKITGLELVDAGVDGEGTRWRDPARTGPPGETWTGEEWASILIRWSDPADVRELRGDGVGLATTWTDWDAEGTEFWTSAIVDLDPELIEWGSWEGIGEYLPVLRHEMGHVLGLDHVDDPLELMHPSSPAAWTFSPGDLAGLEQLSGGACAVEYEQ